MLRESTSAASLIYRRDAAGQYRAVYVAEELAAVFGLVSNDRLADASLWDQAIHVDDRVTARRAFDELAEEQSHYREYRVRQPDGSYRWLREELRLFVGNRGDKAAEVRGEVVDITEQHRTQVRLQESESRLRDLFDNSRDIIYVHDFEGRFTEFNRAALELTGFEAEEIRQLTVAQVVAADQLEMVNQITARQVAGEVVAPYELDIIAKDGSRIALELHTQLIRRDGKPVGIQGIGRDIRGRRKSEAALNARLHLVADSMFDMVSRANADMIFEYISPSHERVLGYAPEQLVGTPALALLHPDDIAPAMAAISRTQSLQGRGSERLEFRYRHANGHYVWLESTGVSLDDQHGETYGIVLTGRDISARRRADAELQNTLSLLRATLESTADGILVVDSNGRVVASNGRFQELWRVPEALLQAGDDDRLLAFATSQLRDPDTFLAKVRELYGHPDADSYDVLEFSDGRVFERFSRPQRVDGISVGRVWSFRDVTEHR